MQAAVVPAVHGKCEVKDVPTPHPATNQVLIKIHASGLCYTPRTIGQEPVGEIVEPGDGVTKRKIGDRVGVPWYQSSCGVNAPGSHAEYMVAYADATTLLPNDDLSMMIYQ